MPGQLPRTSSFSSASRRPRNAAPGSGTPILRLPNEILQQVADKLKVADPRIAGPAMATLSAVSRRFHDLIEDDADTQALKRLTTQLWNSFDNIDTDEKFFATPPHHFPIDVLTTKQRKNFVLLAQMMSGATLRDASGRPLDQVRHYPADQDRHFGLVCALGRSPDKFAPDERRAILGLAVALRDEGKRAIALSQLAAGMQHFDADERNFLGTALLAMQDDRNKIVALEGFGKGLGALDAEQRVTMLLIAYTQTDPQLKETAIRHLSPGLRHLDGDQQMLLAAMAQELVNADPHSQAMSSLCQGFESFEVPVRSALFGMAMQKTDAAERAQSLSGFGGVMELLTDDERKAMVDTVTSSPAPELMFSVQGADDGKGGVPRPWVGLKSLDPDRRDDLVKLATGTCKSTTSLRAMATAMPWLDRDQRGAVVDAVFTLPPAERAKVFEVMGGEAGPHLAGRTQRVIDDVLAMDEAERATAMCGLGRGLAGMDHAQRRQLLDALDRINDPALRARAASGLCLGWEGISSAAQSS